MGNILPFDSGRPSPTTPERARVEAAHWLVILGSQEERAASQEAFASWLAASPINVEQWKNINRTEALLGQAIGTGRQSAFTGRTIKPVAAAGMAIAAGFAVFALTPLSILIRADASTATAEVRSLRLADGSEVRLMPKSAIRSEFGRDGRTVELLAGEALFDVRRDPARPFRVVARNATTTVLGTRFLVAERERATEITVMRGHVRVEVAKGHAHRDLLPGDQLQVATSGEGVERRVFIGYADQPERIAVCDRPVEEVVERVRPWFAGKILMTGDAIAQARVTGIFDTNDPVRALQAAVGPKGGSVTRITPWLLVVSAG